MPDFACSAAVLLLWTGALVAAPATAPSARILPLSDDAWAGSSVNVLGGVRHNLFTDGGLQFAAFYDASGQLVLARRDVGSPRWQLGASGISANVTDAHNHVAIAVDGAGYLHVAWDHHDSPLRYARSIDPGGLDVEAGAMMGDREQSVTYPQFHRLPDGRLLFLYRDGGSGRGVLVVNRYDPSLGRWERLHDALLDGEGRRSAYWDAHVDHRGGVHLAWTWRETPDVASNHDIAYARSDDGGETWSPAAGSPFDLPITFADGSMVRSVPEGHNLMNPPVVSADGLGRPCIANYWSDRPDSQPRFRVLCRVDDGWRLTDGPTTRIRFTLAGQGTRRPPLSRAALFVSEDRQRRSVHLVYRDDGEGGAVMLASLDDLDRGEWRLSRLYPGPVGAWEPSPDPVQWSKFGQAHFLLQSVTQLDGRDDVAGPHAASPLSLLTWTGRVTGVDKP